MYLTTLLTMWYDWRQALFAIIHTHILGYDDNFQGFSISQAGQRVRCEVLNWWAIKKCKIVSDCCSSPKQQSPGRHVTHLGCSSPKQQSPGRHVTHLGCSSPKQQSPGRHVTHLGCSSPKQQSPGRHVTHLGCSSPNQQSPGRHVTHLGCSSPNQQSPVDM
jgi:hypothetical protein